MRMTLAVLREAKWAISYCMAGAIGVIGWYRTPWPCFTLGLVVGATTVTCGAIYGRLRAEDRREQLRAEVRADIALMLRAETLEELRRRRDVQQRGVS